MGLEFLTPVGVGFGRCALGEVITASVEATGLILPWIIGSNYQRLFRAHRPLVQGQKNQDEGSLAHHRA